MHSNISKYFFISNILIINSLDKQYGQRSIKGQNIQK